MDQYANKKFLLELFQDSAIIMRLEDNKSVEFDQLGRQIIQSFISGKTVDEVADELVHQYDVDHIQAKADVVSFMDHLEKTGFLTCFKEHGIQAFPVHRTALSDVSFYL